VLRYERLEPFLDDSERTPLGHIFEPFFSAQTKKESIEVWKKITATFFDMSQIYLATMHPHDPRPEASQFYDLWVKLVNPSENDLVDTTNYDIRWVFFQ